VIEIAAGQKFVSKSLYLALLALYNELGCNQYTDCAVHTALYVERFDDVGED